MEEEEEEEEEDVDRGRDDDDHHHHGHDVADDVDIRDDGDHHSHRDGDGDEDGVSECPKLDRYNIVSDVGGLRQKTTMAYKSCFWHKPSYDGRTISVITV